jgi:sterol desaturase/sphingolipid hydroxylase (fatty acid hydroxylase superfamily)
VDRKTLFDFLFSAPVFFNLLLISRALFFTTLEIIRPARALSYRSVVRNDLIALAAYIYIVVPLAAYLNGIVHGHPAYSAALSELPLALRIVVYFVLADFGHYWVHRLTHTRYFWRVHKWHHSPTYMYWLGGVRATVPQQFLVNVPYILAYPLLSHSPWWIVLGIAAFTAVQNDWMHMNFTWRSAWLEWVFVTPRYHHIHHSADPRHYGANMGNMFTLWDRLFGTHVDPDSVAPGFSFGLGSRENPVRLVLGV